jgi:TRAP-type C4-dicarboxylate transport system permease large subunit
MTPELGVGIALCAIFVLFAALMYTGKLPAIVALPLMAAGLYLVAAVFFPNLAETYPGPRWLGVFKGFISVVIEEGMPRLWHYMIAVILGAALAEQLKTSGASKVIIRWASELGGDNPTVVSLVLTAVCAVLFTSLGGLGAVIMVAGIVLPVLLAIGVTAEVAGCIFLLGLCLGGIFNPVNWQFYITALELETSQVTTFAIPLFFLFLIVSVVFIVLNTRRAGASSFWAAAPPAEPEPQVGVAGLLTPLVPLAILLPFYGWKMLLTLGGMLHWGFAARFTMPAWDFPINAALFIGVLWGVLFMPRPAQGRIQGLIRNMFDGISATAPVAALIIGIGMIIRVVWDPAVAYYMAPLINKIIPSSPITYIVVFTVFAPLALYRGPLNVWGMGIAMAGLMMTSGKLPGVAIMAMLMSVGQIQGVSDPTNTHNVWLAGYLGVDVQVFTRKTLAYTWILALLGLCLASALFVR